MEIFFSNMKEVSFGNVMHAIRWFVYCDVRYVLHYVTGRELESCSRGGGFSDCISTVLTV